MKFSSAWLCAIPLAVCFPSFAHAQFFIDSAQIERSLSSSGPISNGYISPAEKYNYYQGAYIYAGSRADRNRIIYLDYLDRLDRALKFGYPIPADPFGHVQPMPPQFVPPPPQPVAAQPQPQPQGVVVQSQPAGIFGGRFGFWRQR